MTSHTAKRGGRPIKQPHEKRSIQIKLRVTIAEDDYYKKQAGRAGISVAEYLRRTGLNIDIRVPRPAADAELVTSINRLGNNANQIARRVNVGSTYRYYWDLVAQKCAEALDRVLERP